MKNSISLSIIVPCFNCATTLDMAMHSVFAQDLTVTYEVIAVDDGSTDTTLACLYDLQKTYPKLQIIKHDKNLGGGAARNSGIHVSGGKFIYCMDADNILDAHALQRMVDFLNQNPIEGVAFCERRYFLGSNTNVASTQKNPLGKTVELIDLFNGSDVVLDNFMYRRVAFDKTGGYPTQHGFDTQGFEVRFLSQNFKIGICPMTIIYHRQRGETLSYFERVYENGEYSKNMYLIYEEIFARFSERVQSEMIHFDIFSRNSLQDNLPALLSKLYQADPEHFFLSDRQKPTLWSQAVAYYLTGSYARAMRVYQDLIKSGNEALILYWNIIRCLCEGDELRAFQICESLQVQKRKSILRVPIAQLLLAKVRRIFLALI